MPYPRRSPYTPRRDPGRYTSTITDLIQRGGDIQAQNAAIQGDIWGNAIQDVGQIAGQGLTDYMEQKAQEDAIADRDAKLTAFFRNFSEAPPKEFAMGAVEGFGPEMGIQLTEGWFGLQQSAMEMREAQEALQAGEEERAEKHRQIAIGKLGPVHRVLTALGGVENPVVAEMLETTILPLVNQGLGLQLTHEQLRQPGVMEAIGQEVTEAEKLFERDPGKELWRGDEMVAGATPDKEKRALDIQLAEAIESGDTQRANAIRQALSQEAAATRAPESPPGGPEPIKLSAGITERTAGVDQAVSIANNLESLVDEDWLGPVSGRVTALSVQTPGIDTSEELARFYADTATLKNATIKAITGAQMSEPEAKRIMQQIPDFSDKPVVWRQKLRATVENLKKLKERMIDLSGGVTPENREDSPWRRETPANPFRGDSDATNPFR